MVLWAMSIGMVTIINVTMVGAVTSLAGNIPDSSFLAILSHYLGRKGPAAGALLPPLEAASRMEGLRRRALTVAAACAACALGLTLWAFAAGWGAVAMSAVTLWALAANIAFLEIPLALWRKRAARMREGGEEEAPRGARPPARAGGSGREEGGGGAAGASGGP